MNLKWFSGAQPIDLSHDEKLQIINLFQEQTGEVYTIHSLNCLQIPSWEGNVLLKDELSNSIEGVFWSHPIGQNTVRIAAFVLSERVQNQGIGTSIWEFCCSQFNQQGYEHLILEVRGDNLRAISFYERKGLTINETLIGYYSSGPGYSMKGSLSKVQTDSKIEPRL
jgi:GNAT superfamily N-acetyltransferase